MSKNLGSVCAIVGAQWGDEGKGKLVDILSQKFDIIARSAGGANAGHTIYADGKKFVFHLIPSGILHEGKVGVIGNGCVVHLPTFFEELQTLKDAGVDYAGRILLSDRAHLIFDFHLKIDALQEERKGKKSVGTTKRGIGPAYTDKISRIGIRAGELIGNFDAFAEKLKNNMALHADFYELDIDADQEIARYKEMVPLLQDIIVDTTSYLNTHIQAAKTILVEGAQGSHLDIDLGTYPYVTSSNTTSAGACTGTGIAPNKISSVIGVIKAYTTRVGAGPFPSEDNTEKGEKLRDIGGEYGATTGRPRRCGWFDVPVARHAAMINGVDMWNVTKLDVLSEFSTIKILTKYVLDGEELQGFPADLSVLETAEAEYMEMPGWEEDISACRNFDDLPENAQKYIKKLEELTGVPVGYIGVGVEREAMITC